MIEASAPNKYQQIVTFADGERLLISNADLTDAIVSESSERTYGYAYAKLWPPEFEYIASACGCCTR
ncbi:hypothetical protein H6G97_37185 [Nostoc flagelliforme FACHB-838]|uniref:Uncharacterized protein n=1 Tax=Nostoc flagelliforme FACHB-838 TaxID=2692904 RepID=A0ABR8E2L0_9NOSO|nr:hypothetical protein [Nostoc flagelliforme]MBD2534795.1 hypothetical protein [Nostoc flagelliforme FACHB-838]